MRLGGTVVMQCTAGGAWRFWLIDFAKLAAVFRRKSELQSKCPGALFWKHSLKRISQFS